MEDPDNIEIRKAYLPYIINRQFSYFQDTVLFANEMNQASKLDTQMQYDFYRHAIRPRKRFARWVKPEQVKNIDIISKYYGISKEAAKSAVKILDDEAISLMERHLNSGGMKKNK